MSDARWKDMMVVPHATRRILVAFLGVGVAVVLIVHLTFLPQITIDESFVFFRYTQNVVEHGQLTWNLGERGTDGYTSLLYLCVLILARSACRDVVTAAWMVGVGSAVAAAVLAFAAPLSGHIRESAWLPMALVSLTASLGVVAATPLIPYWSVSLMDTTFFALVTLIASLGTAYLFGAATPRSRYCVPAGLSLGLFALARPEGFLICVALLGVGVTGYVLPRSRGNTSWLGYFTPDRPTRATAAGFGIAFVMAAAWFSWHLARYGHAMPNPVYVKSGDLSLRPGWHYLLAGADSGLVSDGIRAAVFPTGNSLAETGIIVSGVVIFLSTFALRLWRRPAAARRVRALLLPFIGLLTLTLVSGGDCFDEQGKLVTGYIGWRFLAPLLPVAAVALTITAFELRRPLPSFLLVTGVLALALHQGIVLAALRPAACRGGAAKPVLLGQRKLGRCQRRSSGPSDPATPARAGGRPHRQIRDRRDVAQSSHGPIGLRQRETGPWASRPGVESGSFSPDHSG
jgi:hypothetical protein